MEEEIQKKAYFLWLEAGKPDGREQYFWDLAEKEWSSHVKIKYVITGMEYLGLESPSETITMMGAGYYYCPHIPDIALFGSKKDPSEAEEW